MLGRIVAIGGLAAKRAARPDLCLDGGILRVGEGLWVLLGVEMIEIAEELVEAVHRRQVFVAVAKVVLAELAGGVAHGLAVPRWWRRAPAIRGLRREFRLGEAVAQRALSCDEGRPAVQLCSA